MLFKIFLSMIMGVSVFNFNTNLYISKNSEENCTNFLLIIDKENSKESNNIQQKLKSRGFTKTRLIYSGSKYIFSVEVNDPANAKKIFDNLDFIEHYEEDNVIDFIEEKEEINTRTVVSDYSNIINLQGAWNYTTGNTSVCVGVIDTGINASHPYLENKVSTSLSRTFIPNDSVSPLTDEFDHGTGVAGVICSKINSECISVCQNIQLVSLKVRKSGSQTYASNVISAIEYASDIHLPILNLSTSWYENQSSYNLSLRTSIEDYNGLVICSASNENENMDVPGNLKYPAGYNLNNVIVVGSSNELDERWVESSISGSNYSSTYVDLFAPSGNINVLRSDYINFQSNVKQVYSTSFAAPMVAGVAALLKSYRPSLTTSQLKDCILYSVDKKTSFTDLCNTGGRLNAYKALSLAYHTHSYSYSNINAIYHKKSCTGCHYSINEEHIWTSTSLLEFNQTEPNYIPGGYRCNLCGAVRKDIL